MKSIRISDDAYQLVQKEAALMSRSIAQQFEHWVRLGMSLEAGDLTASQVKVMLQGSYLPDEFKDLPTELRQAVELIAGALPRSVSPTQERVLRRAAATLLEKHFELQYGALEKLPTHRRQRLAQEILSAEAREIRSP